MNRDTHFPSQSKAMFTQQYIAAAKTVGDLNAEIQELGMWLKMAVREGAPYARQQSLSTQMRQLYAAKQTAEATERYYAALL
jgi:hypothetical protein